MAKQQYVCTHCGRRVFAERGPLTAIKLCRSCFEKARAEQRSGAQKDGPGELLAELESRSPGHPQPLVARKEVKGPWAEGRQVPSIAEMLDEQQAASWLQHPRGLPKEGLLRGGTAQLVGDEDHGHEIARGGLQWKAAKVRRD